MVTAYHEMLAKDLPRVLAKGLLLGGDGDRDDEAIRKTDVFLNKLRSGDLISRGLDRRKNIYCYLADGDMVVDITSGERKPPQAIPRGPEYALLLVKIDPCAAYVSDLDVFDHVKSLLAAHKYDEARKVGLTYWDRIIRLDEYKDIRQIRRPELMVTENIPASNLAIAISKAG